MNDDLLPEPLPQNPLPAFVRWFNEAAQRRTQPNPDAMVLATLGPDDKPSARVVLCKRIAEADGYLVFYTNYNSRKGNELAGDPRAAVVFHWDALHRQVRIEGPVVRSPTAESDAYFASRAVRSRLSAWASHQSEPLSSREELAARMREMSQRFNVPLDAESGEVPRPPHWGGNRLWIESIELWAEGAGRVHERAVWRRSLTPAGNDGFKLGSWTATRLNP